MASFAYAQQLQLNSGSGAYVSGTHGPTDMDAMSSGSSTGQEHSTRAAVEDEEGAEVEQSNARDSSSNGGKKGGTKSGGRPPRRPHLQGRFSGRLETKTDEKKLVDECRMLGPLLGGVGKRGEKSRLTLAKIVRGIASGDIRKHCELRETKLQELQSAEEILDSLRQENSELRSQLEERSDELSRAAEAANAAAAAAATASGVAPAIGPAGGLVGPGMPQPLQMPTLQVVPPGSGTVGGQPSAMVPAAPSSAAVGLVHQGVLAPQVALQAVVKPEVVPVIAGPIGASLPGQALQVAPPPAQTGLLSGQVLQLIPAPQVDMAAAQQQQQQQQQVVSAMPQQTMLQMQPVSMSQQQSQHLSMRHSSSSLQLGLSQPQMGSHQQQQQQQQLQSLMVMQQSGPQQIEALQATAAKANANVQVATLQMQAESLGAQAQAASANAQAHAHAHSESAAQAAAHAEAQRQATAQADHLKRVASTSAGSVVTDCDDTKTHTAFMAADLEAQAQAHANAQAHATLQAHAHAQAHVQAQNQAAVLVHQANSLQAAAASVVAVHSVPSVQQAQVYSQQQQQPQLQQQQLMGRGSDTPQQMGLDVSNGSFSQTSSGNPAQQMQQQQQQRQFVAQVSGSYDGGPMQLPTPDSAQAAGMAAQAPMSLQGDTMLMPQQGSVTSNTGMASLPVMVQPLQLHSLATAGQLSAPQQTLQSSLGMLTTDFAGPAAGPYATAAGMGQLVCSSGMSTQLRGAGGTAQLSSLANVSPFDSGSMQLMQAMQMQTQQQQAGSGAMVQQVQLIQNPTVSIQHLPNDPASAAVQQANLQTQVQAQAMQLSQQLQVPLQPIAQVTALQPAAAPPQQQQQQQQPEGLILLQGQPVQLQAVLPVAQQPQQADASNMQGAGSVASGQQELVAQLHHAGSTTMSNQQGDGHNMQAMAEHHQLVMGAPGPNDLLPLDSPMLSDLASMLPTEGESLAAMHPGSNLPPAGSMPTSLAL